MNELSMPSPDGPAVRFNEVVKRYGAVTALDRATFSVERGETVALLGPNGAGKSTAVDLLLGLRRADAGRVTVLGRTPERAVADGRVGAMLQAGGLPAGARVGELLELARSLYRGARTREELLSLAGLEDLAGRRVERLSGGQAQRVRFALAMAGRPELVFLDEPTVGLDVESRRRFWQAVTQAAAEGLSVLFATHYLEEAEAHADRIVLLHHGRVVREGTPGQITASVAVRTVRATLADTDPARLLALPGVVEIAVAGKRVTLHSADSDATVAALFRSGEPVRDLEVGGAGLEEAFLALTADADAQASPPAVLAR